MNNQIDENLEKKKKKKRNKGKTVTEEREQKRVSVQKHVRLKKENFFYKKREKGKHAKTCIFCLKKSLQKSEKTRNAEVSKYVF